MIILLAFSCGQNSSEKKLNGKWYEIENDYSTWHFHQDSLVFKLAGNTEEKVEWKANKSEIEFEHPTFYWNSLGKPVDTINKVLINYKLSDKKDSLFGTLKNNYGIHKFSMLRTKNYNEYLNRKFGIEFSLPKENSAEFIETQAIYGLKIIMGFVNNKVICKTEFSNTLNNLEYDIKTFKDKLKTEIEAQDISNEFKFHLSVYADKKISDSTITASLPVTIRSDLFKVYDFPRPPNDTMSIKIYRIYQSDKKENLSLRKSKRIKTIANTVYK